MKLVRAIFELFKEAAIRWRRNNVSMLAAALAYYTLFSLAPLVLISVSAAELVATRLFDETSAQARLLSQVSRFVSPRAADTIKLIIENAQEVTSGVIPAVISIGLGLWGASIVFRQLKIALNLVWGIAPGPERPTITFVKRQLLPFVMVLSIGLLLLVSVAVSWILNTLNEYFLIAVFPDVGQLLPLLDLAISLIMVTVLFATIFKVLPDVTVAWRDVWLGAAVAALLFTGGKYLIGFYITNFSVESAYGTAGSLVALLLWIYFSAQFLLFGAEFTEVYANKYGSRILPAKYAVLTRPLPKPKPEYKLKTSDLVTVRERNKTAESRPRQLEKQAAAALLGLAAGLLIALWENLRQNR